MHDKVSQVLEGVAEFEKDIVALDRTGSPKDRPERIELAGQPFRRRNLGACSDDRWREPGQRRLAWKDLPQRAQTRSAGVDQHWPTLPPASSPVHDRQRKSAESAPRP